jgi:hypothetical protein
VNDSLLYLQEWYSPGFDDPDGVGHHKGKYARLGRCQHVQTGSQWFLGVAALDPRLDGIVAAHKAIPPSYKLPLASVTTRHTLTIGSRSPKHCQSPKRLVSPLGTGLARPPAARSWSPRQTNHGTEDVSPRVRRSLEQDKCTIIYPYDNATHKFMEVMKK